VSSGPAGRELSKEELLEEASLAEDARGSSDSPPEQKREVQGDLPTIRASLRRTPNMLLWGRRFSDPGINAVARPSSARSAGWLAEASFFLEGTGAHPALVSRAFLPELGETKFLLRGTFGLGVIHD
jgi:hypothetical protein